MDLVKQYPIAVASGVASLAAQCILTGVFSKVKPFDKEPGFMAHQVVALVLMILLTLVGGKIWLLPDDEASKMASTLDGRIRGATAQHDFLFQVATGMLLFWDIPTGFVVKSLFTGASMGHHVVMCLSCISGLRGQLMYHYAGFFLGLCELSSIPLQIVEIFRPEHFPELTRDNPSLHQLNEILRPLFAVLFMLTRAIYFPYVMLSQAIPDIVASIRLGGGSAGEQIGLSIIGVGGLLLTVLQIFWATLMWKQIKKALAGDDKKK